MTETSHSLFELLDEISRVLLWVTTLTRHESQALVSDRSLSGLSITQTHTVLCLAHLVARASRHYVLCSSQIELVLVDLYKKEAIS